MLDSQSVRVFIFRHGETDWNVEKRWQGHTDIPLNAKGREQALTLAALLAKSGIEGILSSDLSRALETAQTVAAALKLPVTQSTALREASVGSVEGKTAIEIRALYGEEAWRRWLSVDPHDLDMRYPGGESKGEQLVRSRAAIEEYVLSHRYQCVGVSTHGGVVRRLVHQCLPANTAAVPLPNCVVYELALDRETRAWSFVGSLNAQNAEGSQQGPFSVE